MSDDLRHHLGAAGERFAVDHLRHRGYRIVARNVRTRYGELDIVAADATTIVFCEVKTRRTSRTVDVFGGLSREQQLRIRRMASAWLTQSTDRVRRRNLRFDAIGVLIDPTGRLTSLEHLEGCF